MLGQRYRDGGGGVVLGGGGEVAAGEVNAIGHLGLGADGRLLGGHGLRRPLLRRPRAPILPAHLTCNPTIFVSTLPQLLSPMTTQARSITAQMKQSEVCSGCK